MEEKVDVNALIEASLEEPQEEVEETVEEETAPTADETPEEVEEEVEEETEESEEQVEEEEEGKPVPLKALKDERQKRQDLERQLEEIKQGVTELKNNSQQSAPKDIYEAFDRDPQGVTRELNAEISRLSADDPYANAGQIEQLRDLKSELRGREVNKIQQTLQQQTKASQVMQAISTQIPDIATKHTVLTEFAIKELGYTPQELQQRTSFDNGELAVREIIRINNLYKRFHAKPEKKVVKKKPTEVEGAGKGIQKQAPTRQDMIGKAIDSGGGTEAWAQYFEEIGLAED